MEIPRFTTLNSRFFPIKREIYPTFHIYLYRVRNVEFKWAPPSGRWSFYVIDILFSRGRKPPGYRILIESPGLFEEEIYMIYSFVRDLSEKYGSKSLSLMSRISNLNSIHKLSVKSNQVRTILQDFGFIFNGNTIIDVEPCSLAYYLKKNVMKIYKI